MTRTEDFHKQYRTTIGMFATGVTVLLIEKQGDVIGMTANGVSSLSLEPTRLIVCPGKLTRFADFMGKGVDFTVNILGDHQEEHSNFFALHPEATFRVDDTHHTPAFELPAWLEAGRAPRLANCIASIGCRIHEIHEGGDHWIVVGDVVALHRTDGALWPLLFFDGRYHQPSKLMAPHLRSEFNPYE